MPWLLLIVPLAAAAIIGLLTFRKHDLSAYISVGAVVATFLISLFQYLGGKDLLGEFTWIEVGSFKLTMGILADQLARGMMLVVTSIGALVHIFSLGYMKDDPSKGRYFGCLSLFMFSMTGIVLADNFAMMFVFWELVGVSSYLLIGFWFGRPSAAEAAKKAFFTNRVGDFGFMIGILLIWSLTGSVHLKEVLAQGSSVAASPLFGAAILCIFCGAAGKSAQLPLHVWLPDAMEGPTPVSALIHAATMVAAGVYLLARIAGLLALTTATHMVAWIGGLTALFAAVVATQQNDIKRILAYSTLSQLGYMVMAAGLNASNAAMFHLYTHAFFKALLFLGAGAVIYACHHEQDIWKMGGLSSRMKKTTLTFLIGTLALMALPYVTSGFYSKEAILQSAWDGNRALFVLAAIVALLTPFYMTRLFVVAFLGKAKSEHAEHAKEVPLVMLAPLLVLAVMSIIAGFVKPDFGLRHLEHANSTVLATSVLTLLVGVSCGFALYKGKEKDPISIKLIAQKFYLDEIFVLFVRFFHDLPGMIARGIDIYLIDRGIGGGTAKAASQIGNAFRRLQVGNLQAYAFLFGLGVVLLIYLLVFAARVS